MKNKIVFVGAMAAVLGAADASAVQIASKQYVDDQVGEVNTTVTNITNMLGDTLDGETTLEDLLADKADASDLEELESTVNDLESTVDDLESTVDGLESTVEGLGTTVEGKQDKLTTNNFKGENGVSVSIEGDNITVAGTVASDTAFGVVKAGTGLTATDGTLSVDTDAIAKNLAEDDSIKDAIEGAIGEALEGGAVGEAIQDAIDGISDELDKYELKADLDKDVGEAGYIKADALAGYVTEEGLSEAVEDAGFVKDEDLGGLAKKDQVVTGDIANGAVTGDKLGEDLANLKEMAKAECSADSNLCVLSYNGSGFSWVDVTAPLD